LASPSPLGLGLLDHGGLQPQPGGDGQGIAPAGDAPLQVVGGGQALDIKGDGGVLEAGVGVFEGLQFAEVGGGDGERGPLRQLPQQGDG
jgi:hypothetical protein